MSWQKFRPKTDKATLWRYLTALWLLLRDSRTPWLAKLVAGLVVAYALSPVDLIPDFIPVLGLLDDLILVPLGVMLAIRLVPERLWREMLQRADAQPLRLPRMLWGLVMVLLVWAVLLGLFIAWLMRTLAGA
jgi:uncharacterized membrane protein YkvA (DUF1232 family)